MYPESPYGAAVTLRGLRGLGNFTRPPQPNYEDCPPPFDSACVARNAAKVDAYDRAVELAVSQDNFDDCMQNAQNANGPAQYGEVAARCNAQYQIQAAPDVPTLPQYVGNNPPPVLTYTPYAYDPTPGVYGTLFGGGGSGGGSGAGGGGVGASVTFQTSTGNTGTLKPGDTWRITAHGAANSPVVVTGGQNGQSITTQMGSTDGAGNWTATGSIETSQIGSWNQAWKVGGANAGTIAFNVVAATQNQQASATGKPNASVPPTDTTVPGGTGFDKTGDKLLGSGGNTDGGDSNYSPDPTITLYLIAAGLAAVFLMGKGR